MQKLLNKEENQEYIKCLIKPKISLALASPVPASILS